MKRAMVGLVIVAALVAGCGSAQPGAAAVVDGELFTLEDADALVGSYCALNGGPGSAPRSEVRRQAVVDLIVTTVMDGVAEREGIVVRGEAYELPEEDIAEIEATFGDEAEDIIALLERNARAQAVAERIVRTEVSSELSDEQVAELATEVALDAVRSADVEIDPRYGISDDLTRATGSGSLSVPVLSQIPTADLSPTRSC